MPALSSRLVPIRLWSATALGVSETLTSPAIFCSRLARAESLMCQFTSVLGTPQVKAEYAISENGTDFGSFADYTDLISNSSSVFPTPEGLYTVSLPSFLAPWVKIKLTELTGALADTLATVVLLVREGDA